MKGIGCKVSTEFLEAAKDTEGTTKYTVSFYKQGSSQQYTRTPDICGRGMGGGCSYEWIGKGIEGCPLCCRSSCIWLILACPSRNPSTRGELSDRGKCSDVSLWVFPSSGYRSGTVGERKTNQGQLCWTPVSREDLHRDNCWLIGLWIWDYSQKCPISEVT